MVVQVNALYIQHTSGVYTYILLFDDLSLIYMVCFTILTQGHIETIFDCKFCPYNRDILATGSFDGTIKLWDITSMTAVRRHTFK